MENSLSSRLSQSSRADKKNPFYGKTLNDYERAICLNCKLEGNIQRAFGYSYIVEFHYNPSEGIEIKTTEATITINGRNLDILYKDLLRHKVQWIEGFDDDLATEESELFISKIEIEED